jgi:hypothetical protein
VLGEEPLEVLKIFLYCFRFLKIRSVKRLLGGKRTKIDMFLPIIAGKCS